MKTVKLALDWTPNTNHIGFLVAKDLGFYAEEGINLEILNPLEDQYAKTPGKKLALDEADFAIAPFETVISLNNTTNAVAAVAIFAILQEDLSCIATLKSSNISRPELLDGKIYASYKARYEDLIVRQMIKNDGGTGNVDFIYPEKLGIWNTLLTGQADATWIFDNWEGVEASTKEIDLFKFDMTSFSIPYGYSPVILTKKENIMANQNEYKSFVQATKKGFLYVQKHPEQAISILKKYVTSYDLEHIDLEKSLAMTQPYFGDEKTCGKMQPERVTAFLKWLISNNLEHENCLKQELFTNELI